MKSTNKKTIKYTEIEQSEFNSIFSKCNIWFYKGISHKHFNADFGRINTKEFIRPSKEVESNYHFYDEILNNLSVWEELPLRKNSIIGTTSLEVANLYSLIGGEGSKTYVIGSLNSLVAVCPDEDLLTSFQNRITNKLLKSDSVSFLKQLNDEFLHFFRTKEMNDEEIRSLEYHDIIQILNNSEKRTFEEIYPILNYLLKESDIVKPLNEMFDPKLNGFEISTNLKLIEKGPGQEVFGSGEFVMCEYNIFKELYL